MPAVLTSRSNPTDVLPPAEIVRGRIAPPRRAFRKSAMASKAPVSLGIEKASCVRPCIPASYGRGKSWFVPLYSHAYCHNRRWNQRTFGPDLDDVQMIARAAPRLLWLPAYRPQN